MIRWFKPVVFLACLIPLALLGWKAYSQALGANPIEVITHATGDKAAEPGHDLRNALLVGANHLVKVFDVEMDGERR